MKNIYIVQTEIRFKDKEGNWGNWLTPGPTYAVNAMNERDAKNQVNKKTGENIRVNEYRLCRQVEVLE